MLKNIAIIGIGLVAAVVAWKVFNMILGLALIGGLVFLGYKMARLNKKND